MLLQFYLLCPCEWKGCVAAWCCGEVLQNILHLEEHHSTQFKVSIVTYLRRHSIACSCTGNCNTTCTKLNTMHLCLPLLFVIVCCKVYMWEVDMIVAVREGSSYISTSSCVTITALQQYCMSPCSRQDSAHIIELFRLLRIIYPLFYTNRKGNMH